MNKFKMNISEAIASFAIAALVGAGAFFITLWGLQAYWGDSFESTYTIISIWSGVVFGVVGFFLRWNVKK